jgi:hypothetical protein
MTAMSARPAPSSTSSSASGPATETDEEYCRRLEAERRGKPSPGGIIGGVAGGRLGRFIGGKKKEEPPADPRCVSK